MLAIESSEAGFAGVRDQDAVLALEHGGECVSHALIVVDDEHGLDVVLSSISARSIVSSGRLEFNSSSLQRPTS